MTRNRTRRSPRNRGESGGKLKGWLGLAAAVAFLGVGGWQIAVQLSGRSELGEDLCPVTGETSLTAVVVDLTDPLSVPQRQDFLNQLERVRNEVPKYGRLTLYRVDATKEHLLEPVFDKCNPGDGSDITEANGNPKKVRALWLSEFSKPVEDAFVELTKQSGAAESPILESVQSVTLTKLQRPDAAGKPKKLILVSDLLQNSGDLNFYHRLPTLEELRRTNTYRTGMSDLTGVKTEIWMLSRPTAADIQGRSLATLWALIFRSEGAEGDIPVHNING